MAYQSQYTDTTSTDPNKKPETKKMDLNQYDYLSGMANNADPKKQGEASWAKNELNAFNVGADSPIDWNNLGDPRVQAEIRRKAQSGEALDQGASIEKQAMYKGFSKPVDNVGNGGSGGGGNGNGNGNGSGNGNYTPTDPANANLINSMYDKSQNAQMIKLRQARDVALQQLNKIQTGAEQSAYDNRNSADASYYRNANALKELMANNGTFQSGEMNSNFANLLAGNQGELGKINRDLANTTTDVNERRGLINNNAMDSEQALMDTVDSARMGALLNDTYKGQDRQLQIAQLMGMLNGQKTLGGRAQDFNEMDANRNYDRGVKESDRNFDYNKTRDAIKDAQYQKTFDENVRQFGLDYGIKKAQSDNQISVNNQQVQMSKDKLAWDKDPKNPSNQQTATTNAPTRSAKESQYVKGFESLTPERRKEALQTEKATIVADLGIDGYNTLLKMYGD